MDTHLIRWEDHKKEIVEEQQYLFDNGLECDCVLVSTEGKKIRAHQVILSSSSEFFRKILSELPPLLEPPTIHVPDASSCILEAIIRFIYTGETTIGSAYLASLLECCNYLDIKGCVSNGFTLNGKNIKSESQSQPSNAHIDDSFQENWSNSEEYLIISRADSANTDEDDGEMDYLEEYLEEDVVIEGKEEQVLSYDDDDDIEYDEEMKPQFIAIEVEDSIKIDGQSQADTTVPFKRTRIQRPTTRNSSSDIDKVLNEVNKGKTIHRLSVEYNLPRSTLYHRFRSNENLKQNYRSERKSALDSAVRAVLNERLSLKSASDRYKVPKTAIWREVHKCEQYQPTYKEVTAERQGAQEEILSGKSLTSISAKYGNNLEKQYILAVTFHMELTIYFYYLISNSLLIGIPLTTLHRDKKKLSVEGKLPESFRVKDRTENSEYSQRLEEALKKCRSGMSQYQAAKLYNIPKATMWRYASALNKPNRKSKEKDSEAEADKSNDD